MAEQQKHRHLSDPCQNLSVKTKTTEEHVQTKPTPSVVHNWVHTLTQKYLSIRLEPINTSRTCSYVRVNEINKLQKGLQGFPTFPSWDQPSASKKY